MIKMCYGIVMDQEDLATDLGLAYYDDKCFVCNVPLIKDSRFCHKCGAKIGNLARTATMAETVKGFIKVFGPPPQNVKLLTFGDTIAVGHILAKDQDAAVLSLPLAYNKIDIVKQAICNYVKKKPLPNIDKDMKLFSIGGEDV